MIIYELLQGILSAYYIVFVPLYIKQLAPIEIRGACVCFFQLMITIGNLLSLTISPKSPRTCGLIHLKLDVMMFIPVLISIIQNIIFYFHIKNESPMFLAIKDKDKKILNIHTGERKSQNNEKIINGSEITKGNETDLNDEEDKIYKEFSLIYNDTNRIIIEKENVRIQCEKYIGQFVNFCSLWKIPKFKAFRMGLILIIFQQLSGINFIINNSISESQDDHQHLYQICFFTANLIGSVICILTIDKIGRRKMLMIASLIMAFTLIFMTCFSFKGKLNGFPEGILQIAFTLSYGAGPGPIVWLYIVETIPSTGLSFIVMIHWILAGITIFCSILEKNYNIILLSCFGTFSFITIVSIFLQYFFMIETNKKLDTFIDILIQGSEEENIDKRKSFINQSQRIFNSNFDIDKELGYG